MNRDTLQENLEQALRGRLLVDHPFYRRWTMGQVDRRELRAYASQYRHFERIVPDVLRAIAARAPSVELRDQALRNLADEVGSPSHLALFEEFAGALDAPEEAPSAAMRRLVSTYESAAGSGSTGGFAALWAYEVQAPDVSALKARGLRDHYGLAPRACEFWNVHADLDRDHASWAVDAIAGASSGPDEGRDAARAAAEAWWSFLDEREALGAGPTR